MLGVAQDRMVNFPREHERQKRYRGLSEFQKGFCRGSNTGYTTQ